MAIKFLLLGNVEARVDGVVVDLGPARQRCVLVALLMDANQVISPDQLVDRVWGERVPLRARDTLRSYIFRLRKALSPAGDVEITRRAGGYELRLDPMATDLHRFSALLERARSRTSDEQARAGLASALGLWRGEPFAGLDTPWLNGLRESLEAERFFAQLDHDDIRLRQGDHGVLVAELTDRAAAHPLDERLAGQLMLALYRTGRSTVALDHFHKLRERLDELGVRPSPALRELHQRILATDPAVDGMVTPVPAEPPADVLDPSRGVLDVAEVGQIRTVTGGVHHPHHPAAPVWPVPRQLRPVPHGFVGRVNHLADLDRTVPAVPDTPSDGEQGAAMVVISAIGGTGGIGKTWLALTWAHRNLHRFPDGQLFVDLRGFSPTGRPAQPVDVLGGFLDALGVDRDRQPTDSDRRADLYRSLVADKRMLIVLDNAATTDQITPLLPGGHHCTVVITSRNHLRGLIARHGARPIHLGVLTDDEAHTLLTTALGADRAGIDVPAISELIELCGGFPLALGLIAARTAADAHLPLRDIADELRTLGVDALDSEDPTASLPTVLSWSLRHLTDQQRQVFALLGIAPGPDTGLPAAAHLTGLPERETHAVLRALADVSLIDRTPGGRYGMHDLVRAYATTVADSLPADVRKTSLRRVLDFCTHTANAAERILNPHRDPAPLDPPTPDVHPHPLPDAPAALAWLDTEHTSLLAAQHTATTLAWHATVWHLASGLDTYQYRRGYHHDRLTVWQAAADAATHLPDPTTHIRTRRGLGGAHAYLGHREDAINHLHHALTLAEHHHNPTESAHTHQVLATAWGQLGDDQRALEHARRALDLFRSLDQPVREADTLNQVGWYAALLGDYDTARTQCQASLTLHRHHHNPNGEATTLDSLGYIDHHTGHHHQAIHHYHQALTLLHDLGNTYFAADTLDQLGHPHAALSQTEQARTVWREALQLYREQGRHDDATRVQHQLDDLDTHDQPR